MSHEFATLTFDLVPVREATRGLVLGLYCSCWTVLEPLTGTRKVRKGLCARTRLGAKAWREVRNHLHAISDNAAVSSTPPQLTLEAIELCETVGAVVGLEALAVYSLAPASVLVLAADIRAGRVP